MLYGRFRTVYYKAMKAQWYRACGNRLLTVVIVKVLSGDIDIRVFFCTDPSIPVEGVLEGFSGRWNIEATFRSLKQDLGFADSSARKPEAVERTAPFAGLMYSLLVLWFTNHGRHRPLAAPPLRPWYPHKSGLSFADVLRTTQRVLATADILDPGSEMGDLQKLRLPRRPPHEAERAASSG